MPMLKLVCFQGCVMVGGPAEVWTINREWGRLFVE